MKPPVSLLVLVISVSDVLAQPTQAWVSRFDIPGSNGESGHAITFDAQGNVYVAGIASDSTDGRFVTTKCNQSGTQVWASYYDPPQHYEGTPVGIVVDMSGNVYVAGGSASEEEGPQDYVTIKYNSAGVEQWANRYNGPGNGDDSPVGIGLDIAGNVYVSGTSRGVPSGNDFCTIKYNPSGVQLWEARYRGPGGGGFGPNAIASAMRVAGDGTVCVTGWAPFATGQDFATVKYNSVGVFQWLATYAGPTSNINESAEAVDIDDEGNVYVSGTSPVSLTDIDLATIKYDANGVQQWAKRYDFPYAYRIRANSAVHIVTALRILKLDKTTGDTLWTRLKGGDSKASIDNFGNVYTTGSRGSSTTGTDFVTIKYDVSGQISWQHVYSGPDSGAERGDAITSDDLGNIYATGRSPGSQPGSDILTLKLTDPISGVGPHEVIPSSFILHQNYPNPFNPSTKIVYGVKSPYGSTDPQGRGRESVELKVYDLLGREVATLVNEQKAPGSYEVTWDAGGLGSGVYLYRLQAGSLSETRRLILLK
jgi:hypothetical protein